MTDLCYGSRTAKPFLAFMFRFRHKFSFLPNRLCSLILAAFASLLQRYPYRVWVLLGFQFFSMWKSRTKISSQSPRRDFSEAEKTEGVCPGPSDRLLPKPLYSLPFLTIRGGSVVKYPAYFVFAFALEDKKKTACLFFFPSLFQSITFSNQKM